MKPHAAPIFDRIKTSKNLPTLPHILLKLVDACNNQDSTIPDISRIIDKDSSLSAKVMRMVNSAFYGLPARVTSMEQALLLLGTDAIKNLAVSAAVFQVFGAARGDRVFNLTLFWYHSLLCATMAELIAKKTSYSSSEEAFLSGLLHDIGKLVLWVNFPKDYSGVLESSQNKTDLISAEEKHLGATHPEVGAWMIQRWHLQSFMADAVLFHHEGEDSIQDALPLVKVVFLANLLSTDPVENDGAKANTAQMIFGLSPSDVEDIIQQGKEKVDEVARSFGMDIAPPQSAAPHPDTGQEKEIDLLRNVRDVSLLQGTLQNLLEAYGQESILAIVRQGLQVLFDVNRVVFLLFDPEQNALVGKEGRESTQDSLVKEVAISLETKNCLPVQSLEQKIPLDSFGHLRDIDLTIMDRQIIRLMGEDGVLCLPMTAHRQPVGVIVMGIEQARVPTLGRQLNLATLFANQSALALYTDGMRQTQAKLVQSERLAAASAIAKKVAHEVNNPLGIIKNYVKIFGLKLPKEDPVQEELKIISEELDRVALIVRQLSGFSEPEVRQTEPVDVNEILSDLVKITRESFMVDSKVKVHLDLASSLPTVFSEKNSLKQVFINLIKNAVEAMPRGGNLFIATNFVSRSLEDTPGKSSGDGLDVVEISISDEGPGIPDAVRSKIFEPYVTSKKGQHAGLGLSVVYNIVKKLHGDIACKSGDNGGTTFHLVLPVALKQTA